VSVVLREAHGFEGFRVILKIMLLNHQASAHGEHLKLRLAGGHATARSMRTHLDRDEKAISEIEQFLWIETHVLEALKHASPNFQVAVMAVKRPAYVEEYLRPVKLDSRIKAGEEEIEVPAIRCCVCLAKTTHEQHSAKPRVSRQTRPRSGKPTGKRRDADDDPFIQGSVSPRCGCQRNPNGLYRRGHGLLRHRPPSIALPGGRRKRQACGRCNRRSATSRGSGGGRGT
jgi:hypothetical protein